jgi:hypothetical protein
MPQQDRPSIQKHIVEHFLENGMERLAGQKEFNSQSSQGIIFKMKPSKKIR